ncbi:SLAM family member 5-like [Stegostoma tigrinum]|uniref:SLAM family member 5-like n=1 Tax=Stegostoma tigrinum TaxID=3053191 RepID=UPI0028701BDB|nr:SLAM family member 5-like [Stegostoma tigrinum]
MEMVMSVMAAGLLLISSGSGQWEVNIKIPHFLVNGTVGHSVWLLVEIDPIPQRAEITWKFSVESLQVPIARFDVSENKSKIFPQTEFEGRTTLHHNHTLQIDNLRVSDGGTYTVTVTTRQDYTEEISLQVYEPVSVPTMELIQNVSAERCNVTLRCSVGSGSHIHYTWTWLGSNVTDEPVEQVSGNPGELEVSVGLSHSIHYCCTVWNPVSEESAEFRIETPCTKSQEALSSWTKQATWVSVLQICLGGTVLLVLMVLLVASKFCTSLRPRTTTGAPSHTPHNLPSKT